MGQAKKREIKRGLATILGRRFQKITLSEVESAMKHEEAKRQVWVLVEGMLDVYMYSKVFNDEAVQMRKVEKGKTGIDNIKKALIAILENRNNAGVKNIIGIVDRDYERLLGIDETKPNLFETDGRDLEITLLTDAHVRREIMANIPTIDDLCSTASPALRYIGYMYIAARQLGYHVRINGWGLPNICTTDGALVLGYEQHVLQKLNSKLEQVGAGTYTPEDIDAMVSALHLDAQDDKYIWRGHSTLPIIAYMFNHSNDYNEESISILLADCCDRENALNWDCFKRIKQWQEANGYDILSKEESLEETLMSI